MTPNNPQSLLWSAGKNGCLSAARCLESYAKKFDTVHRDIADDFRLGAAALKALAGGKNDG